MTTPNEDTKPAPDLSSYTEGQRDVLRQLCALRDELGLSDGEFVRKHLTLSSTTWSRINNGTYAADVDSAFIKLELNLRQLRVERAQTTRTTGGAAWYSIITQQSVINAVSQAKLKPVGDPDRAVFFLAPTGGGKTATARQLKVMHDGILVEARESWRDSYYAALCDVGLAAGISEDELGTGKHSAEQAVLKKLRANRRVLIIDEGEYFGARTINLLKLILNQTETVIVVMTIPVLFTRWQARSWVESEQLNRRAHAVVVAGPVLPDDVKLFFAGAGLTGASDACATVAKAANEFGSYDTVREIVGELAADKVREVTKERAEKAVSNFKSLRAREVKAA
jgi:hypothetical protein